MPKQSGGGTSWVSYQGKRVGRREGRTFVRRVNGPEAQLRRPPAWALWRGLVDQLVSEGFETVQVEEGDAGPVWIASLDDFHRHGIALDRGQGPQLALPLGRWARLDVRALSSAEVAAMVADVDADWSQLVLSLDLDGGALT